VPLASWFSLAFAFWRDKVLAWEDEAAGEAGEASAKTGDADDAAFRSQGMLLRLPGETASTPAPPPCAMMLARRALRDMRRLRV